MSEPDTPNNQPIAIDVKAGKSYWWCTCGKSKNQPFCDGSHKGSEFSPMEYQATEDSTQWFCTCKKTKNSPMCDGSHKNL